jgi:hypothetical protein
MSNLETTRRIMEALAVPDFDRVRPHITDDWVLEGPAPVPLGWDEFVAVHGGIVRGMSDFDWHLSDLAEDGDEVSMTVRITATHDGVIDVPLLGVEGLAPTGTRIEHPQEAITFTFRGDEVARVEVASGPGGGMVGLLEAVGATIPAPPG